MHPKRLILVIERDPPLLSCLMLALSVNGYRVIGVHSLEQAIAAAREHPIDAIHSRRPINVKSNIPLIVSANMQETIAKLKLALLGRHRKACRPLNVQPVLR